MNIYATYTDGNKISECIFTEQVYKDLISGRNNIVENAIKTAIPLKATGKTYEEKQQSVRDVILDISSAQHDASGEGLSYYEESIIYDWCRDMAKRYGLIREFEANGII